MSALQPALTFGGKVVSRSVRTECWAWRRCRTRVQRLQCAQTARSLTDLHRALAPGCHEMAEGVIGDARLDRGDEKRATSTERDSIARRCQRQSAPHFLADSPSGRGGEVEGRGAEVESARRIVDPVAVSDKLK